MLFLTQLFLATAAIVSALILLEEWRLLIPLSFLIAMFVVGRVEKNKTEKKLERLGFLHAEIEQLWKKDTMADSLISPKSELLLIDAVHYVFKDLGFKVSTGVHYQSVDRIVKIPETRMGFGLQILMCEGEVEGNHPKINRALQFEKEKKEDEKSLIIASPYIHLPHEERPAAGPVSKELNNFFNRHNMYLMTTQQLHDLWQKAKAGEIDIFKYFEKIYSQSNETIPSKNNSNSHQASSPTAY